MILDSEEQRVLLLKLLKSVHITGTYSDILVIQHQIGELLKLISNAPLSKPVE